MRNFHFNFLIVCGIFLAARLAFGDGFIVIDRPILPRPIPIPGPAPAPEYLAVKYHRVNVTIDRQVATTTVDQVFKNDKDYDLEGTYIFPIPEDAAIKNFSLYIDGKKLSGEILDKDRARMIYEDIVRRMKDPGLLEYVGRNMFKARIYPIPKHGERRVEISYQQTVPYDGGMFRYTYPLNTEKFSPKPIEEVAIAVKITSDIPIKSVYSPGHEVDLKVEQYKATCGYEEKNVRPDKDFALYYTVSEKDMGLQVLSYRKGEEDGYFMLLLSPGELENKAIGKDIVFVIDTSGSMSGEKLKQAKSALKFCLNNLGKDDRFNIVSFATGVSPYANQISPAQKENVLDALHFVDGLESRGGTDINEALLVALRMFPEETKPRMIVFLTDGEPTVGVTEIKSILKNLEEANRNKVRIFVFGVGDSVNTHLLDMIAEKHRGASEYVLPKENIEVKVSSFYRKISEPVLSDISLNFSKVKVHDMYPVTLPDIFNGTQLVVLGRYKGQGSSAITLTGTVGEGQFTGRRKSFVYEKLFTERSTEYEFIPRLWATRKIGYLLNEIRLNGENQELKDEIVQLSKEFGIMTPYTSFLVLENEKDYKRWGITPEVAPAVRQSADTVKNSMRAQVGGESVAAAKSIQRMEHSRVADNPAINTVKQISDKTFYLRDGAWVDATYKEEKVLMRVQNVKYLSAEYFNLLKEKPQLGKFFAIGKSVTVVFEGVCYRVLE